MKLNKKQINLLHTLLNAHNGKLLNFGKKPIDPKDVEEQEMTSELMYFFTGMYLEAKK